MASLVRTLDRLFNLTRKAPVYEIQIAKCIQKGSMNSIPPQRTTVSRWVQCSVLFLIFAAGGIVGAMLATKTIHSRMNYYRDHPEALAAAVVTRLKHELGLNEEQVGKVKEIVTPRHARIAEYQQQSATAIHNEFTLMEDEVAEVLDEKQKALWRELTNSVRERYLPKTQSGAIPADLSEGNK